MIKDVAFLAISALLLFCSVRSYSLGQIAGASRRCSGTRAAAESNFAKSFFPCPSYLCIKFVWLADSGWSR